MFKKLFNRKNNNNTTATVVTEDEYIEMVKEELIAKRISLTKAYILLEQMDIDLNVLNDIEVKVRKL